MLWLSIAVAVVCICAAAWVAFLLLGKHHTNRRYKEDSSPRLVPPGPIGQPQELTQMSQGIDEVARELEELPTENEELDIGVPLNPSELTPSTGQQVSNPDLPKTTSETNLSVALPSVLLGGEGSTETQEKKTETHEPTSNISITPKSTQQNLAKQVRETTEKGIGQEEPAVEDIEQQQVNLPKLRIKKKRQRTTRPKAHVEDSDASVYSEPELKSIEEHEWLQDLDNEEAEFETRGPAPYRPPSQEPLTGSQRSAVGGKVRRIHPTALALSVRLQFVRSGYCKIGLLPQRMPDMPEEIMLADRDEEFNVSAIQDEWYEDVFPERLEEILANGVRWKGRADSELVGYWQLSGRDLYVLSGKDSGFVQTTRLRIGRKHVVLCRDALGPKVEEILGETGCRDFKRLPDSYGTPLGWTAIRDVIPTAVVKIEAVPDILSILQPQPELEIDLEGGVYLKQSTWLAGFPPRICVSGALSSMVEVFVDGEKAVSREDNSFETSTHNAIGEHIISVPAGNISKTYRICEISENWRPWNAYNFAHAHLCGPFLLALDVGQPTCATIVPSRNPVLLGSHPGEIACCPKIPGPRRVGFAAFDPVWALPDDPFGMDKLSVRVLMLKPLPLVPEPRYLQCTGKKAVRVSAWCAAILNASRKGLHIEPEGEDVISLWKEYKRHARSLRKKMKG